MGNYCLIGYKVPVLVDEKGSLGMDGGDGSTAMPVYLMLLNCTLKNGKLYVYFITFLKISNKNY